jgi:flavin-dependent dehydrogenase
VSALAAEVVVVGGGPAGAATAAWLARLGHDALVLEKTTFPREKPCAEYLSPGVVAALDRLGALAAVRACESAWPRGMRVCTSGREVLLPYADGAEAGDRPTALGIARPLLDQALLDGARAAGARVREQVRVRDVLTERGRVVGVVADGERGPERLLARVVVAADGLNSVVTRCLGLDRPTRWPRRLGLVARYADARGLDEFGEMHVGRGGVYCGLGPVGGGLVSVGLAAPLGSRPAGEPIGRFFERQASALPGVARALAGARRVTPVRGMGPIARRRARVAGPGYLLVGDAAGFLDPFTGEGVYRALRGAELAAEAISRALRTGVAAGDGLAADYARARRRAFADKERVTALVQLCLGASPFFDYALARLAGRPGAAARLSAVLGDLRPAGPALRPGFLWRMLRP